MNLKVFAVSGGDPTQNWAQGRMQGLRRRHQGGDPRRDVPQHRGNGLLTTYDPAGTYDAYKAFIQGNPNVQFIENVDIGAEHADRAIKDPGKTGKIFTIGWNVSIGQLDAVKEGTQVAALDQQWGEQAGFGARGVRRAPQERQGPAEHQRPQADPPGQRGRRLASSS